MDVYVPTGLSWESLGLLFLVLEVHLSFKDSK